MNALDAEKISLYPAVCRVFQKPLPQLLQEFRCLIYSRGGIQLVHGSYLLRSNRIETTARLTFTLGVKVMGTLIDLEQIE